jgi:hypothetical protein
VSLVDRLFPHLSRFMLSRLGKQKAWLRRSTGGGVEGDSSQEAGVGSGGPGLYGPQVLFLFGRDAHDHFQLMNLEVFFLVLAQEHLFHNGGGAATERWSRGGNEVPRNIENRG